MEREIERGERDKEREGDRERTWKREKRQRSER